MGVHHINFPEERIIYMHMHARPFLSSNAQVLDYIICKNHVIFLRACGQCIKCLKGSTLYVRTCPSLTTPIHCYFACGELKASGIYMYIHSSDSKCIFLLTTVSILTERTTLISCINLD